MRFGVFGAGSIGCYVGGRLAHGGHDVRFVGRPALAREVADHGLALSDCDGFAARLAPAAVHVDTTPAALGDREVILVTVKSRDTAAAVAALAPVLAPDALIVSLQNGVRNAAELARALPAASVVAGMVPFNVVRAGPGAFHRAMSGDLILGEGPGGRAVAAALSAAGMRAVVHPDVVRIQWGKLLLNLNNALNALAGVPLRTQLGDRTFRRVFAAAMDEALAACRVAGIRPAASLKVPPLLVPPVLRLPDPIFVRLAGAMLKIDPTARSSMWEDLERRRPTEVDALNGEVVRLAEAHGRTAELNKRIVTLVKGAEARAAGSPGLSAAALAGELGLTGRG